ncbi:MAG: SGNH/GDSL hydrolase family protein [Oscillospiraceae bacterium]|nr:SGNH/GDSL hydrolase family protein [Oscillospiraceae bacterium]
MKNSKSKENAFIKLLKSLTKEQKIILLCGAGVLVATVTGIVLYNVFVPQKSSVSQTSSQSVSLLSDSTYDKNKDKIDTEKYKDTVLGQSEDAGEKYIEETLFIGDSNTARFMSYGKSTLENTIGIVSMGIQHVITKPCVGFYGYTDLVTIPEAVKIMQPKRIIITFGTNNTLGYSADTLVKEYKKALEAIHTAYPYADIIINAVPPIGWYRGNENITMQTIDGFNVALAKMAKELGYKFLNSAEVLKDEETGFAKENYTLSDGIHLNKEAMEALFTYFRTHSYITEDKRPALKTVPQRKETPPGIITNDPLFVPGQTQYNEDMVEVLFDAIDTEGNVGGGFINGAVSQSVEKGTKCTTVTAVPNSGYTFSNWKCNIGSIEDVSNSTLTFTVPSNATEDVIVTAIFKKTGETSSSSSSVSSQQATITSITLSGPTTLYVGDTGNYTVTVHYSDNTTQNRSNISYTAQAADVGTTKSVSYTESGKTGVIEVAITAKPVTVTAIVVTGPTSITVGTPANFVARVTYSDGSFADKPFSYTATTEGTIDVPYTEGNVTGKITVTAVADIPAGGGGGDGSSETSSDTSSAPVSSEEESGGTGGNSITSTIESSSAETPAQ